MRKTRVSQLILLLLDRLSWKPPPLSEAKVVGDFTVLSEALAADFSYFGKLNRIEEFFDSIEKYRGKGLESVVESYDDIIVISHIKKGEEKND